MGEFSMHGSMILPMLKISGQVGGFVSCSTFMFCGGRRLSVVAVGMSTLRGGGHPGLLILADPLKKPSVGQVGALVGELVSAGDIDGLGLPTSRSGGSIEAAAEADSDGVRLPINCCGDSRETAAEAALSNGIDGAFVGYSRDVGNDVCNESGGTGRDVGAGAADKSGGRRDPDSDVDVSMPKVSGFSDVGVSLLNVSDGQVGLAVGL